MDVERTHNRIGSWIVVSRETGHAVVELFDRRTVNRINTEKYVVVTAQEWLGAINKGCSDRWIDTSISCLVCGGRFVRAVGSYAPACSNCSFRVVEEN